MELIKISSGKSQFSDAKEFLAYCDYAISCAKVYCPTYTKTGSNCDNDYTIFELVKILYREYDDYVKMFPKNPKAKDAKKNMLELEHFVVSSIQYPGRAIVPQVEIDIEAKKQIISAFYKEHNIDENYMKTGRTKEEEMDQAREQSASLDW